MALQVPIMPFLPSSTNALVSTGYRVLSWASVNSLSFCLARHFVLGWWLICYERMELWDFTFRGGTVQKVDKIGKSSSTFFLLAPLAGRTVKNVRSSFLSSPVLKMLAHRRETKQCYFPGLEGRGRGGEAGALVTVVWAEYLTSPVAKWEEGTGIQKNFLLTSFLS